MATPTHPGFRIFLLEAGFSRPAGLPLASALYPAVKSLIERQHGTNTKFDRDVTYYLSYCNDCGVTGRAHYDANKQMMNPLKVLTSGVERIGRAPFFSGGRWRFAERVAWWDDYVDPVPVVVGNYWRRVQEIDRMTVSKGDVDLFQGIAPFAWHGKLSNVLCVDFSVGGRWSSRKDGKKAGNNFRLAALRWPEKTLQFDDGESVGTD